MKYIFLIIQLFWIQIQFFAQTNIDSTKISIFYFDNNKYEIVQEVHTWIDAAKIAEERGGILSEINSQTEQDTIFYYLNNVGIDITKTVAPDGGNASYVWIGGNDLSEEGIWMWDGNYDGIGNQFWEGTQTGNSVHELYNNWGNEPDDFSNQDALGLALTNWARGVAGEWNDLQEYNQLYFVIEYDNSTFKVQSSDYLFKNSQLKFEVNFNLNVDSLHVVIDNMVYQTFYNISSGLNELECFYFADSTKLIDVYLVAFFDSNIAYSNPLQFEVYSFDNPVNSYTTDFEDIPIYDFMTEEFKIGLSGGFRDNAIHSPHNYDDNVDINITLKKPIIINSENPIIMYSDVAIVEPGDSGVSFGDNGFKDYVVVEGMKNKGDWEKISQGYDSREYNEWQTAWSTPTLYRYLYKQHSINLTNTFEVGDTILLRFRLHADDSTNGWGWVIDSLQVQDTRLEVKGAGNKLNSFYLQQNYPNPFNPTTTIRYLVPELKSRNSSYVKLVIYDVLGREIATLVKKEQQAGNYEVKFDANHLTSGTYFYRLQSGDYSSTKKMLLLR